MTPPIKTQQALPDGAERAFAAHAPPLASKEPSPPRPTVHLLNCMLLYVVRITSGARSSGGLRSCDLEKFASGLRSLQIQQMARLQTITRVSRSGRMVNAGAALTWRLDLRRTRSARHSEQSPSQWPVALECRPVRLSRSSRTRAAATNARCRSQCLQRTGAQSPRLSAQSTQPAEQLRYAPVRTCRTQARHMVLNQDDSGKACAAAAMQRLARKYPTPYIAGPAP